MTPHSSAGEAGSLREAHRVVALFGPTGTGKTALACAIADRLPCRLISCDALQLYRHLRAAVAKPEGDELRHPWRLVDAVEPGDDFNAGRFARAAADEIEAATAEGLIPLVVGGTGLYLRALIKGLDEAPARDDSLRARLAALRVERGDVFLHRMLGRLDVAAADRLSPRDSQRVERALEVVLSGGELATSGRFHGPDRYRVLRLGLELPRDVLVERLDARVERFFGSGLIEEVEWLLREHEVSPTSNALRAIGYREVVNWIESGESASRGGDEPPSELVRDVQLNTRRYAKRQMTWFRKETPASWHDPRSADLAETLAATIESWWRTG